MSSLLRFLRTGAIALAVLIALIATSGCDEDRKPPPAIFIVILSDPGTYLLNQKRVDQNEFDAEMRRIADENRRPLTGQVRAYVYIDTERGADFYRTDGVADQCQRLGFMNIVRSNAGMK